MLAPVNHVLPLTMIQRTRALPIDGEVVVRSGQEVRAVDVVARADLNPKHLMLNVPRGLGISADEATRLIEREVGDEVEEGDVIATRKGLGRRIIRAPAAGRIVLIGGGQVLIRLQTEPYELRAGYSGVVTDLIPERGAVIEAVGALIQGAWGNGKVGYGLMTVLAEDREHVLTPDQINVGMRGAVIFGGLCDQEKTLEMAKETRLRALILGNLDANLVAMAAKMPYPIIVIDGFSRRPMNAAAFKLLSTNNNRDVAINAEQYDPNEGKRPEVHIPLPGIESMETTPPDMEILKPGQRVRILRGPHRGRIASIGELLPDSETFPSGVRAPAARVTLGESQSTMVMQANLEIIK